MIDGMTVAERFEALRLIQEILIDNLNQERNRAEATHKMLSEVLAYHVETIKQMKP
jgi:hypothetical protein